MPSSLSKGSDSRELFSQWIPFSFHLGPDSPGQAKPHERRHLSRSSQLSSERSDRVLILCPCLSLLAPSTYTDDEIKGIVDRSHGIFNQD